MCTASIGSFFKANAASIGTGMQIAGVGSQVFGAYRGAQANQQAAQYQAQIDDNNAMIAGWQSKDALNRGVEEERRRRLIGRQDKGSSIASAAARGLDISEGSILNILTDIDMYTEEDALLIRNNARKEAWGYDVQRNNYRNSASLNRNRADAIDPMGIATSTLLTGAGNVAASWYRGSATKRAA